MDRYKVLVTAQHLVPEAQQILRDGDASIEFMADPINEETLLERLASGATREEMLAKIHGRKRVTLKTPAATLIRKERESA